MTPEGRIKLKVDAILRTYAETGLIMWVFKPVQSGYGKRALDYLCCVSGRLLAIETKSKSGNLTSHQRLTAREIYEAGGVVFIISSAEGLQALAIWLGNQPNSIVRTQPNEVSHDEANRPCTAAPLHPSSGPAEAGTA